MARLDSFLRMVVDQNASDLHFHAGNPPLARHDGDLIPLPFRTLTDAEARRFLYELLDETMLAAFKSEREIDLVHEIPNLARFRGNIFEQSQGIGAVFRIITNDIPTIDDLGMPPSVRNLTMSANGLVLVTGPTGAGKTTTLASMVHEINRTQERHIITVEDPIEFIHQPIRCHITQRQVGKHAESFASALRSALRESPDVLVVGEMRDTETIELALHAAETGVLVFGTLHTNSAVKTIDRIIGAIPAETRDRARAVLSVILRGVIAQRLCKKASGEGRVAAVEIMLQNWAVSNMIRESKLQQLEGMLHTANPAESGMQSMDRAVLKLVKDGYITIEEGFKLVKYPDALKRQIEMNPEE